MPCSEVPVLDILLHEFRALAGMRGRNAHRGHHFSDQTPKYDHTVKVEIEDAD